MIRLITVISLSTGNTYTGTTISFQIDDDNTGKIFLDNRLLVTYSSIKSEKQLERLLSEDFIVLEDKQG